MLKSLQIKNYILIDSLDISFPAGLIIISGQTGAGKSILLGALGLVLGSKADSSMVGETADKCVVEAVFELDKASKLAAVMEENGLDWNDGNIIIRRVLSKSGRSRSFVNDEPVAVSLLSVLASFLVDIHSQHQTLILRDKTFQLSVLDAYSGNSDLLSKTGALWHSLQAAKKDLQSVEENLRKLALEREYKQALYEQLEGARLREDELQGLEEEQKILANAEQIKDSLSKAVFCLEGEQGDCLSVIPALKEASRMLSKCSAFLPQAAALIERLESSRLEISDISAELESLSEDTVISPERLEFVESRMQLLYDLLRKHGCSSISELLSLKQSLCDSLNVSESLEDRKAELKKQIIRYEAEYSAAADALHNSREKNKAGFAEVIQQSIRSLDLERAVFEVSLSQAAGSETGRDSLSFNFSSTGRNVEDIAKCASGGELSRIMLALKALMSRYSSMPSMIFDEIDTGVSGSAADKMGKMICLMGQNMQVFAITHLPQVAAKGQAHYLVSKTITDDSARTDICMIKGESRLMEIARMLSGSQVTSQAIENARALISQA